MTVEQTAAQDQVDTAAGVVGQAAIVNGDVVINDVNAGSATAAGTIETVTLSSFADANIDSSALKTVNLSGTGGTVDIGRGALTATPTNNTLALNVAGLTTTGAITDSEAGGGDDGFTTIDLAASGEDASSINTLAAADLTTLNVSGDAEVSIGTLTAANVETITSTNTGGVTIGNALGNDVTFTGAAGDDSVILGANTNATEMGAGDDTVTLTTPNLGAGGSVNGGEGNDTLVANVNGSAYSADPAVTGFETLRVAGTAAEGSHNANGFTALEVGTNKTASAITFTSVAAGTGLTVLSAPTDLTTVTMANATGEEDSFDLTFASEGAIDYSTGGVSIADVETINITSTDTETGDDAVAHTNALNLTADSAESIVVTGNAGLNLTGSTYTNVTSFNASGIQGEADDAAALGVTFVSGNTTVGAEVAITGGAGEDSLTGSASANDTINGGAGDDKLVYTGGADSFTGGAGEDTFDVNELGTKTDFLTVQDAGQGDLIDFAGVVNGVATLNTTKVTLGAAATFDQYLDAAVDAQDATTNSAVRYFEFDSNTYVVVDNQDAATTGDTAGFTAGEDMVVQLAGSVDLSDATINAGVVEIA